MGLEHLYKQVPLLANCNRYQGTYISLSSELHALLFEVACTNCIVFFCSLLRFSSIFPPPHPLPPFNKAGLLAWVHTCHFHLHVAGWVGPLPHLSFHSLPGGACASLVGSSVTLQGVSLPPFMHHSLLGCVAATLIALLIITRVCCCHPSCLHVAGCVAATPPFYARVHPTTCSPIYCQLLCSLWLLSCMLSDRVVNC